MQVHPYQAAAAQHLARLRQTGSAQHQQALDQVRHQQALAQAALEAHLSNNRPLQPVVKK
jgi:hypothetical protein